VRSTYDYQNFTNFAVKQAINGINDPWGQKFIASSKQFLLPTTPVGVERNYFQFFAINM